MNTGSAILQPFFGALVIDDDEVVRQSWRSQLSEMGGMVDAADSPEAAEQYLATNTYNVVILDDLFDEESTGVHFAQEKRALFKEAEIFLVTGNSDIDEEVAREVGAQLIRKSSEHIDEVLAYVRDIAEPRLRDLQAELRDRSEALKLTLEPLEITARERFIDYLTRLDSPDSAWIIIDGTMLSPNDLANEVRRGTELGRRYVDLFLEEATNAPLGQEAE